jgi:hypothetical protein
MEPIECSETSAISTQTPGKHPKENILQVFSYVLLYLGVPVIRYQVLGTYERSAVTSAQNVRRGATRIKDYTSMLNGNVNKWVYRHEEGTGTCSSCSSQLSFLYIMPTAVSTH